MSVIGASLLMAAFLGGWDIILILTVVILLFAAKPLLALRSREHIYATAASCGAMGDVLHEPRTESWVAQTTAIVVTLGLRLAAIRWRWKMPAFTARQGRD